MPWLTYPRQVREENAQPLLDAQMLTPAPLTVGDDGSLIAPIELRGLPALVRVLGERWRRKSEFHLTALAARATEPRVPIDLAIGRSVGPVEVTEDLRRVSDPARAQLRTLIVLVRCDGLARLYRELGLGIELPPAHITLYSTDPDAGIGIVNERELETRAPPLSAGERRAVREAIGFEEVFRGR